MHEHVLSSDGCGWVGARLVILTEAILLPSLPLGNGPGHTVLLNLVVAHDLRIKSITLVKHFLVEKASLIKDKICTPKQLECSHLLRKKTN